MLLCAAIASHLGHAFYKKGPEILDIRIHFAQISRHVGLSYLIQTGGTGKFGFYYLAQDDVVPDNVDAVFAIYHETHYKNWFGRCKVWLQAKVLGKRAYIVKIKQDGQIDCFCLNPLSVYKNIHKLDNFIPKGDGVNFYIGAATTKSWRSRIYAEFNLDTTTLINALYGVKHET